MDDFGYSSSPSSYNVDSMQEQLAITRTISGKIMDSTIISELQNKVNDMLRYKEMVISLQSQLKISQETNRLLEAEFAFQRSEFEKEIEYLKQKENQIQKNVPISQSNAQHQYDVDVKIHNKSNISNEELFKKKYQKWKEKAKNIVEKNRNIEKPNNQSNGFIDDSLNNQNKASMSKEVIGNSNELKLAKEKIKSLTEELKKYRKEHKQEMETMSIQISKLKNEKEEMKVNIRNIKGELESKNLEMKAIIEEQTGRNNSTQTISNKIETIEEECQRLRLKVNSLTKDNHHLKEQIELLPKLTLLNQHCEIEYANLCDIFGIEPGEIGKQWSALSKECQKISTIQQTLEEAKQQNSALQKRISSVLKDKKSNISQNDVPISQYKDDYFESEVKNLKGSKEILEKKINDLRYKSKFSSHIVNFYSFLVNQITYLHDSLFGNNSAKMRPLILSVVFARRFFLFKKNQTINDETALNVFAGRLTQAADTKLAEIKQKISSLSEDLLDAKKQLAHFTVYSQQIEEESNQNQFDLQNSSDKLLLTNKKLVYLKSRMANLQEELGTLIPNEVHHKTCQKLQKYKARNENLKKEILELQNKLKGNAKIGKKMQKEIQQYEWKSSKESLDFGELNEKLKRKQIENETLQIMLNEKVKEVLALERIITRMKKQNKIDSISLNAKSAENIEIKENISYKVKKVNKGHKIIATLDNTQTSLASIINPAFLK